jgi:hypothetical protein
MSSGSQQKTCVFFLVAFCGISFGGCLPPPKNRTTGPRVPAPQESDAERVAREQKEKEVADRFAKEEADRLAAEKKEQEKKTDPENPLSITPPNAIRAFVTFNGAGQYKNCFGYKFSGNDSFQQLACNKAVGINTCVPPSPALDSTGTMLLGSETIAKPKLVFKFETFLQSSAACADAPGAVKQYQYNSSPTATVLATSASVATEIQKQIKCGKKIVSRDGKSFTRWKVCFEDNPKYDSSFNDFTVVFESENPDFELDLGVKCRNHEVLELNDTICK